MKFNKKMEVLKMTDLNLKKEYNNVSSTVNNMDVFDVYVNDWGVLQYGFRSDYLKKQKEYKR